LPHGGRGGATSTSWLGTRWAALNSHEMEPDKWVSIYTTLTYYLYLHIYNCYIDIIVNLGAQLNTTYMKHAVLTQLGLGLISCLLFAGCAGKDGDPGPQGSQGPSGPQGPSGQNLTGNIVGFIEAWAEGASVANNSGVTVSIDGSTPLLTAVSNAAGRFEIQNIKSGTYNLSFSKNGYTTYKVYGVAHVGGENPTVLPNTYPVIQASNTTVSNLSLVSIQPGIRANLFLNAFNNVLPDGKQVVVFMSNSSGVSSSNFIGFVTEGFSGASNVLNFYLDKSFLNSSGFPSGSRVYMIAYGANLAPIGILFSYRDPATGKPVFLGLSPVPSQEISFIVP
jgi:hypothetical protein